MASDNWRHQLRDPHTGKWVVEIPEIIDGPIVNPPSTEVLHAEDGWDAQSVQTFADHNNGRVVEHDPGASKPQPPTKMDGTDPNDWKRGIEDFQKRTGAPPTDYERDAIRAILEDRRDGLTDETGPINPDYIKNVARELEAEDSGEDPEEDPHDARELQSAADELGEPVQSPFTGRWYHPKSNENWGTKGWRDNWKRERRDAEGKWTDTAGVPSSSHVGGGDGGAVPYYSDHQLSSMSKDDIRFKLRGLQVTISGLRSEILALRKGKDRQKLQAAEAHMQELQGRYDQLQQTLDNVKSEDYLGKRVAVNDDGSGSQAKPSGGGGTPIWSTEPRDAGGRWTTGGDSRKPKRAPKKKPPRKPKMTKRQVLQKPRLSQSRDDVAKNGLKWGGKVFPNKKRFTEWLKEHDVTWEEFAKRHPDAAKGLVDRGSSKSAEFYIGEMDLLYMESVFEGAEVGMKSQELVDTEDFLDEIERELKAKKIPDRGKLDDSVFAIPETRSYPVPDEEHGKLALGRCKGKPEESRVRAFVLKKFPGLKEYAKEVLG